MKEMIKKIWRTDVTLRDAADAGSTTDAGETQATGARKTGKKVRCHLKYFKHVTHLESAKEMNKNSVVQNNLF